MEHHGGSDHGGDCHGGDRHGGSDRGGRHHPDASSGGHHHGSSNHEGHGHCGHRHGDEGLWVGLRAGVLTLSDSRTRDNDRSGDVLEGLVLGRGGRVVRREILADERRLIAECLRHWADSGQVEVILTTGGTGAGPRDVTPEATREVCERELPGLAELIRRDGLRHVPTAVLTRGIAAFRGQVMVINLPGSSRGAAQGFEAVAHLVPHAIAMARGMGHP
ncbi:MAG: MogA/MoaB family molybdenum cofactor biosynthesis protein [Magnetococcales bacterium]|nr:MogA/MoaB family molybdenum cofactor biosynthesis protein [Magnetococcales bacterium]